MVETTTKTESYASKSEAIIGIALGALAIIAAIIAIIVAIVIGNNNSNGPTGPTGPTGATGATGAQGQNGSNIALQYSSIFEQTVNDAGTNILSFIPGRLLILTGSYFSVTNLTLQLDAGTSVTEGDTMTIYNGAVASSGNPLVLIADGSTLLYNNPDSPNRITSLFGTMATNITITGGNIPFTVYPSVVGQSTI